MAAEIMEHFNTRCCCYDLKTKSYTFHTPVWCYLLVSRGTDIGLEWFASWFKLVRYSYIVSEETVAWHLLAHYACQHRPRVQTDAHLSTHSMNRYSSVSIVTRVRDGWKMNWSSVPANGNVFSCTAPSGTNLCVLVSWAVPLDIMTT
jgi:hypothetical protein